MKKIREFFKSIFKELDKIFAITPDIDAELSQSWKEYKDSHGTRRRNITLVDCDIVKISVKTFPIFFAFCDFKAINDNQGKR